jgi:hypothetical protein
MESKTDDALFLGGRVYCRTYYIKLSSITTTVTLETLETTSKEIVLQVYLTVKR